MPKLTTVKVYGTDYTVDEHATESDMRRAATHFFNNRHGLRETFSIYRGCIIVRMTRNGKRDTVAYLFAKANNLATFFCLGSNFTSVKDASKGIDKILDSGIYKE